MALDEILKTAQPYIKQASVQASKVAVEASKVAVEASKVAKEVGAQAINISKDVGVAASEVGTEWVEGAQKYSKQAITTAEKSYTNLAPAVTKFVQDGRKTVSSGAIDGWAGLSAGISSGATAVSTGVSTGVRELELSVLGSDHYHAHAVENLQYGYETFAAAAAIFAQDQKRQFRSGWAKTERRYTDWFFLVGDEGEIQGLNVPSSWDDLRARLEPGRQTLEKFGREQEFAETAEPITFWSSHLMILFSLVMFFVFVYIINPFGFREKQLWSLPARFGCFLMDSPGIWVTVLFVWDYHNKYGYETLPVGNGILLGFFVIHYVQKSIINPFTRMRAGFNMPGMIVV